MTLKQKMDEKAKFIFRIHKDSPIYIGYRVEKLESIYYAFKKRLLLELGLDEVYNAILEIYHDNSETEDG